VSEDQEFPLPKKFRGVQYVLQAKTLVEVDPEDGQNFYAYDIVPFTEEYRQKYDNVTPIEVYVEVNPESTLEFEQMVVGQKFVLEFAGPQG